MIEVVMANPKFHVRVGASRQQCGILPRQLHSASLPEVLSSTTNIPRLPNPRV
jgi:hypothetical protein